MSKKQMTRLEYFCLLHKLLVRSVVTFMSFKLSNHRKIGIPTAVGSSHSSSKSPELPTRSTA